MGKPRQASFKTFITFRREEGFRKVLCTKTLPPQNNHKLNIVPRPPSHPTPSRPSPFSYFFFLPCLGSDFISYIKILVVSSVECDFEGEEKLDRRRRPKPAGESGGMLPQKMFKTAISCVFCRTFSVNKNEGKCSNFLFMLPSSCVVGKVQSMARTPLAY